MASASHQRQHSLASVGEGKMKPEIMFNIRWDGIFAIHLILPRPHSNSTFATYSKKVNFTFSLVCFVSRLLFFAEKSFYVLYIAPAQHTMRHQKKKSFGRWQKTATSNFLNSAYKMRKITRHFLTLHRPSALNVLVCTFFLISLRPYSICEYNPFHSYSPASAVVVSRLFGTHMCSLRWMCVCLCALMMFEKVDNFSSFLHNIRAVKMWKLKCIWVFHSFSLLDSSFFPAAFYNSASVNEIKCQERPGRSRVEVAKEFKKQY